MKYLFFGEISVNIRLRLPFIICSILAINFMEYGYCKTRTDVERFQLLKDKIKVDKLMRPYKRFNFDLEAALSKEFIDVADKVEKAGDSKDQSSVISTLQSLNDTEYFLFVSPELIIPFPSFGIGETRIYPSLKGFGEVGANFSISERAQSLPGEIAAKLAGAGIPTTVALPYIQAYAQMNVAYGFDLGWTYKSNWFGNFFLHTYDRRDIYEIISVTDLVGKSEILDTDDLKKENKYYALDFKIGHEVEYFKTYISIQELKLATSSENSNRQLATNLEPLFHYHAQYYWDLYIMRFTLYAGMMKRDSYKFYEGFYKGFLMDFKYFPLEANIFIDNEYITLQPRIDLWLITLDASFKHPLNQRIAGFKQNALFKIDFRISI